MDKIEYSFKLWHKEGGFSTIFRPLHISKRPLLPRNFEGAAEPVPKNTILSSSVAGVSVRPAQHTH